MVEYYLANLERLITEAIAEGDYGRALYYRVVYGDD